MNTDLLIKMVNEISAFFDGESGSEQAPKDVAAHIKRYWEKRMRQEIVAHFEKGGAGLSDTALGAIRILASG